MNETPILMEGVNLMVLGMGFVFSFLLLLVWAITALAAAGSRFAPKDTTSAPCKREELARASSSDETIAAISVALHHHKKKQLQN